MRFPSCERLPLGHQEDGLPEGGQEGKALGRSRQSHGKVCGAPSRVVQVPARHPHPSRQEQERRRRPGDDREGAMGEGELRLP